MKKKEGHYTFFHDLEESSTQKGPNSKGGKMIAEKELSLTISGRKGAPERPANLESRTKAARRSYAPLGAEGKC